MQQTTISKRNGILIIIVFWLIYFFIDIIANGLQNVDNKKGFFTQASLFTYTMYIVQILTILFNYLFIAPTFLKKINWRNIFISIFLSFLFFISLRYGIEQILTDKLFGLMNYHPKTGILFYVFDNFHFASFVVFSSFLLWIVIGLIQSNEKNQQIEREKSEAEIKFLKAQINPHFLFNTLNNIYSLVSVKSDLALSAIENLSSIMRFTTYESNKEKIELHKEINYINEYLKLEELRFGNRFFIQKKIDVLNEHQLIYPFLISPLIENALKHGILKDQDHPVEIMIKSNQNEISIHVKNKINSFQKDTGSGIGLENLRKRLTFYFNDNYKFDINQSADFFEVDLIFPLYE